MGVRLMKIGIVGHFGNGLNLANGQTIKTKILSEELSKLPGVEVLKVDTHGWKKRPFHLLLNCIKLTRKCENIIILPALNGLKALIPLFSILNKLTKTSIHYVVIGGWLPGFLSKNKSLIPFIKQMTSIHVETHSMIEKLKKLGIEKTHYMPNFKQLKPLSLDELVYAHNLPYKICTFSRVLKEKGIEDAIKAVTTINEAYGKTMYTLDIYGDVDENYKERFKAILERSDDYIQYKNVVAYDQSVETLKNYFLLLFPTYYPGEGFAGTLLDSFASGVPVVASNWKYNGEIIQTGINGMLYELGPEELHKVLENALTNPQIILNMKHSCLLEYQKFHPQNVVERFVEIINKQKTSTLKILN